MKGTERLFTPFYINSEHTEREITTSYSDMLKELAFLKHTHTRIKTRLACLGTEKLKVTQCAVIQKLDCRDLLVF